VVQNITIIPHITKDKMIWVKWKDRLKHATIA
jgi:hypothetical protein